MKLSYPAIFYPWEGGKGYTVDVPDMPGCVTQGDTLAEAVFMGIDAASGWILTSLELGRQIPTPSPMNEVKSDPEIAGDNGSFVNILALDIDEYAKKWGVQTLKKTLDVEIPAYLSSFAEEQRLDFSKIMQDALNDSYRKHYEFT